MGKLDQLRELRESGAKAQRSGRPSTAVETRGMSGGADFRQNPPNPAAKPSKPAAEVRNGSLGFEGSFATRLLLVTGAKTLDDAIKRVETTFRRRVASTKTTECAQCARRRKAKAKSMARYRAKLRKKK